MKAKKYFRKIIQRLITLRRILLNTLVVLSLFFILLYPFIIASRYIKVSIVDIIIGSLCFLICLFVCIELMYWTFAQLYRKKRKTLFLTEQAHGDIDKYVPIEDSMSVKEAIAVSIISYLLSIYIFAVAYLFIGNFSANAFIEKEVSFIDTFFLSFTTISVGPSGLQASSNIIKVLVMIELAIGLVYTVLVFSIITTFISSTNTTDKSTQKKSLISRLAEEIFPRKSDSI